MTIPATSSTFLDPDQKKEQFSHAYIHAIATAAGFSRFRYDTDMDSIDVGLTGQRGDGKIRSPKIDIQLKCTSSEDKGNQNGFTYPLKTKNYNDLRDEQVLVPRILVIVTVPTDEKIWLEDLSDHMIVRHCAYWLSLRGQPHTKNLSGLRIQIPRTQRFNVATLTAMMDRVRNGGLL